jgi:hypothetical protein
MVSHCGFAPFSGWCVGSRGRWCGRPYEAAVRAAITLPWSNGQTEGQITKLKLIKRQMYEPGQN